MLNLIIHILGYAIVGFGLGILDVSIKRPAYWLIMLGVTVVYFNALFK